MQCSVMACSLSLFDKVKFVLNLVRCYVANVPLIKRGNSRPEATMAQLPV